MLCFFKDFYYHHATNAKRGVIPLARESSNKYFLVIKVPSMALDPGFHAGMTGSLNLSLISKLERKDTRFMHRRSEAKPRELSSLKY